MSGRMSSSDYSDRRDLDRSSNYQTTTTTTDYYGDRDRDYADRDRDYGRRGRRDVGSGAHHGAWTASATSTGADMHPGSTRGPNEPGMLKRGMDAVLGHGDRDRSDRDRSSRYQDRDYDDYDRESRRDSSRRSGYYNNDSYGSGMMGSHVGSGYGMGSHYGSGMGSYGAGMGSHYGGYGMGSHYGTGMGSHYGSGMGSYGTGSHYGGMGSYGTGMGSHYGGYGMGSLYGSGMGSHYGGYGMVHPMQSSYGYPHSYGMHPSYYGMDRRSRGYDDDMSRGMSRMKLNSKGHAKPLVDIYPNNETEYIVEMDLPGFVRENIDMKFIGDVLEITATPGKRESSLKYHVNERYPATYYRKLYLPPGVDAKRISAVLSNGVLRVMIPRTEGSSLSTGMMPTSSVPSVGTEGIGATGTQTTTTTTSTL